MPDAALSPARSPYIIVLARGARMRTITLRPITLRLLLGVLPALAALYLGATGYLVFRDDIAGFALRHQADVERSYEAHIARLHEDMDRAAATRKAEHEALDTRVRDLAVRQAQFEAHEKLVSLVAPDSKTGPGGPKAARADLGTSIAVSPAQAQISRALNLAADPPRAGTALGYAPLSESGRTIETSAPPANKPRPEQLELHSALSPSEAPAPTRLPTSTRIASLLSSLDHLEADQQARLGAIGARARSRAANIRAAMARTGFSLDRLAAGPVETDVGGPFVPIDLSHDRSDFGRQWVSLQSDIVNSERLEKTVIALPVRTPFSGPLDVTSPFGARIDPFLGRMGLHTGIDLRQEYGSAVHATGAGRVSSVGPNGGYGNMVEIDHGNGLTTRYAHLSAILVTEGQQVDAGAIVGRIGTTGRSTGPHLHYEVRLDGEAVDPNRWFDAGVKLAAARG